MSFHPIGWSKEGAGKLSELRIYWKKGGRTTEGRKRGREERGRRESIQYPGCDQVGKEESKEKWEICRSTTGESKPSDRDESVFLSSDNRDLWVRVRNEESPSIWIPTCYCSAPNVIKFSQTC